MSEGCGPACQLTCSHLNQEPLAQTHTDGLAKATQWLIFRSSIFVFTKTKAAPARHKEQGQVGHLGVVEGL